MRKVVEQSTAGECTSSLHVQTEPAFRCHGPCQLAVLATSSDHLPCTIMIETSTGAEAEDTQDLVGPAKTIS